MSGVYLLKPRFVSALAGVEDRLVARSVPAGVVSAASVVFAVAAGGALVARWWLLVPLLVVGRLACNALDGAVARRTGTASRRGEVRNEAADRAGDVATLGALAFVVPPLLALLAVTSALAVSWVGVLGRAVAGTRLTGGPMGKADRMAVLAVAAVAAWVVGGPAPLAWAAWIVVGGSGVTILLRLRALQRGAGDAR